MEFPELTEIFWEEGSLVYHDDDVILLQHPTRPDLFLEAHFYVPPGVRGGRIINRAAAQHLHYLESHGFGNGNG